MFSSAVYGGVWVPSKSITEIRDYGNGIAVYGHDLSNSAIPCSDRSAAMPDPGLTGEQINRLNSIILAAYISGKPIILKVRDNTCSGNFPVYYAVRMK
jgi:hypothetical protein